MILKEIVKIIKIEIVWKRIDLIIDISYCLMIGHSLDRNLIRINEYISL